ncbi:WhiB family transcriptional regulator [Streptomyces sp. NBC_00160]|uniref:WhiB family transcriptional regulator n=1 Tax=Streptomyces sp. NBC_00160 TaxID=2903628 RepID=UPI0022512688|nr:WhiB family transcriptional regulator [Streptomyces sp. NBC_00160]MCX5308936.1 WhiB family transcriptional regulator [Streptomyces sp. NBC_00160]
MRQITTNTQPVPDLRGIADISWHDRGNCHDLDTAEADRMFFPAPRAHADIAEAKTLCGACPVRQDCFTHAMDNDIRWGLWGGLTEAERKPWRAKVAKRLNYQRVRAALMGRDVHPSAAERDAVTRAAHVRGWSTSRLAYVLGVDFDHARDLLRRAAHAVADRDRYWKVPAADSQASPAGSNDEDDNGSAPEETFCQVPRQAQTRELNDALRKAA